MSAYQKTKKTLQDHSLAPNKRLGQNFLVHQKTAEAIVNFGDIAENDTVIEVGPGLGALTTPLASRAARVIAIEIDRGIIRYHEEENDLPDNVILRHEDILKADFTSLADLSGQKIKILANLPYSISNPFIFKLIEHHEKINWVIVMLQKEVAERLTASPGTKEYGIPTVLLSAYATVKQLMTLKPSQFHPKPKIDSMVVRISFDPGPERLKKIGDFDRNLFNKIVRASFSQRRKTLLNTLTGGNFFPHLPKAEAKQHTKDAIISAEISPTIRAEMLVLEDFIRLSHSFNP